MNPTVENILACYHCGEKIAEKEAILHQNKVFCCTGCKAVFQVLDQAALCQYYDLNVHPGAKSIAAKESHRFAFLDQPELLAPYLVFENKTQVSVRYHLPQIHCSSCLWLFEHFSQVHPAVVSAWVDFPAKEVTICFRKDQASAKEMALLLASLGYEPLFSAEADHAGAVQAQRQLSRLAMVKIGVAGFCFANIMMMSFPEYLGLSALATDGLRAGLFRYLNLALSLPVLFYSGAEFFANTYHGLRQKKFNIDAPIALALAVTFLRSLVDIFSGTGPGYLDSMSGIIFFMLVGRSFQTKTFANLRFNRDHRAYFPMNACKLVEGKETYLPVRSLQVGDTLLVRNQEIVPVDAWLIRGKAQVDYAFVSGENDLVAVPVSGMVYAGGKQMGGRIELKVMKPFSQSRFTQLWNQGAFAKAKENETSSFTSWLSNYFTLLVFGIAGIAFLYWLLQGENVKAWWSLTAVLIVACPCALLLTTSFTQGFLLNIFSSKGFYLKNAKVLTGLTRIRSVVVDKTGTLTHAGQRTVVYTGADLSPTQLDVVKALFAQSLHPLSRAISAQLGKADFAPEHFKEIPGKGLEAWHQDHLFQLGSGIWLGTEKIHQSGTVWVVIDKKALGFFVVHQSPRQGTAAMLQQLAPLPITLLSGDNNSDEKYLKQAWGNNMAYHFDQTPLDKLKFVQQEQAAGRPVLMVGDGLNDAGALRESEVGIAIAEDTVQFTPASDAILLGDQLPHLPLYLTAARQAQQIIYLSFVVSTLYNTIGVWYAVSAQLSPLMAAILMPMSTLTIVLTTMVGAAWIRHKTLQPVLFTSKSIT